MPRTLRLSVFALLFAWANGTHSHAIDPIAWDQFKSTHSLILFLNNTSTKTNRCAKVKLADLQESPRTLTEDDYDPNWVGGQGVVKLLPKETELVSLIPKGTGAVCNVYQENGTNEDGCTYLVVIIPDPFLGKFYEIRCGSNFQCRAAIVVPNT